MSRDVREELGAAAETTRLALATLGQGTTHEVAQAAQERFGFALTERQAAHWLGQLRMVGCAQQSERSCEHCGGRGVVTTWLPL